MPHLPPSFPNRFTRSLCAGGFSTCVHWTTMAVLIQLGYEAVLSTAIGALAGAGCNYWLQFKFAFRAKTAHATSLPAFALVAAFSWLINIGLFSLLIHTAPGHDAVAQFATTAAITALNFFMYKKVVFNEHNSRTLV